MSALLVILLAGYQPVASGRQSADPQVIAVEDITPPGCEFLTEVYADDSSGVVIDSWTEPCPPATNLHTFVTTESDAAQAGLTYVVVSGDATTDAVAAESLVSDIQVEAVQDSEAIASIGSLAATSCSTGYRSKTMRILTYIDENSTPGATVLSKAYYYQFTDRCDILGIVMSRIQLQTWIPSGSGQKLYWYRLDLTMPYYEGDTPRWPVCPQISNSRTYVDVDWRLRADGTWWAKSGTIYKDKLINSIRLGCEQVWGETYPNQMRLP